MSESLSCSWSGVFPAATTQFDPALQVDLPATQQVQAALLQDGVHGLVLMGTVGEGNSLSAEEKRRVLAAAVEVSYYQEDGQDEHSWVFVGPTPESIRDMQRRRMADDISALLARHFGDAEIGEAVALVNQLFARRAAEGPQDRTQARPSGATGKKHLH